MLSPVRILKTSKGHPNASWRFYILKQWYSTQELLNMLYLSQGHWPLCFRLSNKKWQVLSSSQKVVVSWFRWPCNPLIKSGHFEKPVVKIFLLKLNLHAKKWTCKCIAWWIQVCNQHPDWEREQKQKSLCIPFQLLWPFLTRAATSLTFLIAEMSFTCVYPPHKLIIQDTLVRVLFLGIDPYCWVTF